MSNINTHESAKISYSQEEISSNNHVYSFSTSSGDTRQTYCCNTTGYTVQSQPELSKNFYSINLDYFLCSILSDKNCRELDSYGNEIITIQRNENNKSRNRYTYIISINDDPFCEAHAITTTKEMNTIRLQIYNHQLYTSNWCGNLDQVLTALNFQYVEVNAIHIALDGNCLTQTLDTFNSYLTKKSIVRGNDGLRIEGHGHDKNNLQWETFYIGNSKSGKSATLYNKSKELEYSKKDYISAYWCKNGLNINATISRFELKLTSRVLRNYNFNNFYDFNDTGILNGILKSETENWLVLHRIKVKTKNLKGKYQAIKEGTKLTLIDWDKLPSEAIKVEFAYVHSDESREAKRSVTFMIKELQKNDSTTTSSAIIEVIMAITEKYKVHGHANSKVTLALGDNPNNQNLITLSKKLIS